MYITSNTTSPTACNPTGYEPGQRLLRGVDLYDPTETPYNAKQVDGQSPPRHYAIKHATTAYIFIQWM